MEERAQQRLEDYFAAMLPNPNDEPTSMNELLRRAAGRVQPDDAEPEDGEAER